VEADARKNGAGGTPAWVMTFADLMSLLLAFFVLMFSFSELDKNLYKQVAGSMRDAFGVQREVRVKTPPKGINIIAQEFSPGMPSPTPLNEVRQFTTDDSKQELLLPDGRKTDTQRALEDDGQRLRLALAEEIAAGMVELEMQESKIVLRIREHGSFPSGSDRLKQPFKPVLRRLAGVLEGSRGRIVVSGHTDDVPIATAQFRSNWELSACRAVTVVHELLGNADLAPQRVKIEGLAATQPVDDNRSAQGRARNRRVEITVVYGQDEEILLDSPGAVPSPP
jgi:chemotaxis protein MotB